MEKEMKLNGAFMSQKVINVLAGLCGLQRGDSFSDSSLNARVVAAGRNLDSNK